MNRNNAVKTAASPARKKVAKTDTNNVTAVVAITIKEIIIDNSFGGK